MDSKFWKNLQGNRKLTRIINEYRGDCDNTFCVSCPLYVECMPRHAKQWNLYKRTPEARKIRAKLKAIGDLNKYSPLGPGGRIKRARELIRSIL